MTKILFASDVHGEVHLYEQLPKLANEVRADVLILGGDLFPSFSPSKSYDDTVPHQKAFIKTFLLPFFAAVTRSLPLQKILTISGNWDMAYPSLFEAPVRGLIDLNEKGYRLENGYELIGYPFVPPTPFRPKEFEKMDDPISPWPAQKIPSYVRHEDHLIPVNPYIYLRSRETIQDDLERLPRPLEFRRTIYVMHSPPFGTGLDTTNEGLSAGSRSIRKFIERNQPLVTLHGHIHESPRLSGSCCDRIGETLCINPGQFTETGSMEGKINAVIFEPDRLSETIRHTTMNCRL